MLDVINTGIWNKYHNYPLMQHFRDRFNTFGTVSSVEVIQRADENGM